MQFTAAGELWGGRGESRRGDGERVPFAEDSKVNMPDALGKPSPLPNGHLESSGNLGPTLCEV